MTRIVDITPPKNRPWMGEEERLLGIKSDRAIARKFVRTIAMVVARRHQKRIRFLEKWNPKDDEIFRHRSDAQVANASKCFTSQKLIQNCGSEWLN
jgi:hypothetical protein